MSARDLAKEAEAAYKANRYEEAAELLKRAFADTPVPKYLYNMARAYDQAGDLEQAMQAYHRYVALPAGEVESDLLRKANLAMDRIRSLLAQREAEQKLQEAERQRLADEARAAQARAEDEARRAREQREAFERKEREAKEASAVRVNVRRVAAFVVGGTALAAAGVGVGFGVAANGSRSAFAEATTLEQKRELEAATRTRALVADVALATAIVAATSAILLFPRAAPTSAPVAVTLGPAPQGAGVSLMGVFP